MRRLFLRLCLVVPLLLVACAQPAPPAPTSPPAAPTSQQPAGPTSAPQPTTAPQPTADALPTVPADLAVAPIEATLPEGFNEPPGGTFANYKQAEVRAEASAQALTPAPDLSNVELTVLLTPEQRAALAQHGFAVSPGEAREFYEVYEQARYDYVPALITSDSLLHSYHLVFDSILRRVEAGALSAMLARLDWELAATSLKQAAELAGTPYAEAARRNAAYFAVPVKLLHPEWELPAPIADLVEPDLAGIAAHAQPGPSAIFPALPRGEDWTQYTPRGHYTISEELQRYFQAMMWHGRMAFPTSGENQAELAIARQQELLLVHALRTTMINGQPAEQVWSGIYNITAFFVGESDDLTPLQAYPAFEQIYGQPDAVTVLVDDAKLTQFQEALEPLRQSQIVSGLFLEGKPDQGMRFMGQRLVPDAAAFQRLLDPQVPGRTLPTALDFFAVLGSERALAILEQNGTTAMEGYTPSMNELQELFAGYDEAVWTQNLYWGWLYSLLPLLTPPGQGYPFFMQSPAWVDKQLNTALGSWTELKHDTLLYAKQVYVEGAGGMLLPPTPEPPKGYVEPLPELYARVGALALMTREGLSSRGVLDEASGQLVDQLIAIATQLQTMAEKQLRGEELSDEEYTYIRTYGRTLEQLTLAAAADSGFAGLPEGDKPQAAIIADVATDSGGAVLYQAIGRINNIYAAVPVGGRLVVARGGVFAHYEFTGPLTARLTNEQWRRQLDEGGAPPAAEWTASFLVDERVEQPLAETIRQFNEDLVAAFWYSQPAGTYFNPGTGPVDYDVTQFLSGAELEDTNQFIAGMRTRNEFIGMRRVDLAFRSFDLQGENNATVTTRERWDEQLYSGTIDENMFEEPAPIGKRNYEVNVTYTMEKQGERWLISKIVIEPEPPGWSKP